MQQYDNVIYMTMSYIGPMIVVNGAYSRPIGLTQFTGNTGGEAGELCSVFVIQLTSIFNTMHEYCITYIHA